MKKLLSVIVLVLGLTPLAFSLDSYVRLSGGLALLNDSDVSFTGGGGGTADLSYDAGFLFEGAYGINLNRNPFLGCGNMPMRVELALGVQKHDWDTWTELGVKYDESMNSSTFWHFMGIAYWDFYNESPVTPFVLAGLGLTQVEIDHGGNDYSDTVLGGLLGAGAAVEVAENVQLDVQYRYWMSQDVEFSDTTLEASSHQFLFGARYAF